MERVIRILGCLVVMSMLLVGTSHAAYLGADFGGTLKVYDSSSSAWTTVDTGGKAVQSITVWGSSAVFGFGSGGSYHGLYTWDGSLSGIGDYNATKVVPWGGGGGLAISTSSGILKYNGGTSWTSLSSMVPDRLVGWYDGGGYRLAASFSGYGADSGIWSLNGSWDHISTLLSDGLQGYGSNLVTALSSGIWKYQSPYYWGDNPITSQIPTGMLDFGGSLVAYFGSEYGAGGKGVWKYTGTTFYWDRISSEVADKVVTYGGMLIGDFGSLGLFKYSGNPGYWDLIDSRNPLSILAWGAGVAVDFGAGGLYNYDGSSFVKIADGDPNLNPTAAPVPSALILLASGLLGLVGIRRKFTAHSPR